MKLTAHNLEEILNGNLREFTDALAAEEKRALLAAQAAGGDLDAQLRVSTAREALEAATDALRAAGVDSPRLDAEVLLAHATGASARLVVASPEAPIDPVATRAYAEFVRRRLRREPVAYITGRKGFRRIELGVDRRVLIPRPETELLVELALELQPAERAGRRHGLGGDRARDGRRAA